MGSQDGMDIVVRAADIVIDQLGRDDIAFALIGSGDFCLVALRDKLSLAGRQDRAKQLRQLLTLRLWYRNVRSAGVAA